MKKIIKHFKENWIKHGFETLYVIVGILVAFSLDDWNEDIQKFSPKVPVILIGNKKDLNRKVTKKEVEVKAQKLKTVALFETSAKTGEGVNEAFADMARRVIS